MELVCKTPTMSPALSPPLRSSTRMNHRCGEESEEDSDDDDDDVVVSGVDLFQKIKDCEQMQELRWDNEDEKVEKEVPCAKNQTEASSVSDKHEQSPNVEHDLPFTNKLVDSIQVARKRGSKRAESSAEHLFEQQKLAARKRLKLDEEESPQSKDAPIQSGPKNAKPQEKALEEADPGTTAKGIVKKAKDTPARSINITRRTLNFNESAPSTAEAVEEKRDAKGEELIDSKEDKESGSAVVREDAQTTVEEHCTEKKGTGDPSGDYFSSPPFVCFDLKNQEQKRLKVAANETIPTKYCNRESKLIRSYAS